jgi:hypothetical protein
MHWFQTEIKLIKPKYRFWIEYINNDLTLTAGLHIAKPLSYNTQLVFTYSFFYFHFFLIASVCIKWLSAMFAHIGYCIIYIVYLCKTCIVSPNPWIMTLDKLVFVFQNVLWFNKRMTTNSYKNYNLPMCIWINCIYIKELIICTTLG